jgi:hypothetical protein
MVGRGWHLLLGGIGKATHERKTRARRSKRVKRMAKIKNKEAGQARKGMTMKEM